MQEGHWFRRGFESKQGTNGTKSKWLFIWLERSDQRNESIKDERSFTHKLPSQRLFKVKQAMIYIIILSLFAELHLFSGNIYLLFWTLIQIIIVQHEWQLHSKQVCSKNINCKSLKIYSTYQHYLSLSINRQNVI